MGSFEKTIALFDSAAGDPRRQRALLAVAAEFAVDGDNARQFEVATRVTGLKELYGTSFFDEEMDAETVMALVGDSLDEIIAVA